MAVSGDGQTWFLLNTSPDVSAQITRSPVLHPRPGSREPPLRGVLLTDAEVDHSFGLVQLRQATSLTVYASRAVLDALSIHVRLRQVMEAFSQVRWVTVIPGRSFELEGGILVRAFALSGDAPRYVVPDEPGDWTVGYRLTTGHGVLVYAPSVKCWSAGLDSALAGTDTVLFDGTFWSEDELGAWGDGRTASGMGHLPVGGPSGSASRLASLQARRRIYVHVNNTNPMLDEESEEHRRLAAVGLEVSRDATQWEV